MFSDPLRHQRQRRTIVALLRQHPGSLSHNFTGLRVGNKPLGALPGLHAEVAASVGARLPGNQQNHHTGIAFGISDSGICPDFPLASNLQRHIAHIAASDVGQRDHGDLAATLRPHIRREALDLRCLAGRNDPREIVHHSHRSGNLRNGRLQEQRKNGRQDDQEDLRSWEWVQ